MEVAQERKDMIRILSLTAIILIHCLAAAAQTAGYAVVDRESGFTIHFPGVPQYQEGPNPVTGERQESYFFNHNGDTLQIIVTHSSNPPRSQQVVSAILSDAAGLYNSNGSVLIKNVKLSPIARQFDTVQDTPTGRLHMRSQLYLHGGKVYTLSYGSFGRERYDEPVARTFLSSFSFRIPAGARSGYLNNSSPRSRRGRGERVSPTTGLNWQTFRSPDGDFSIEFPNTPANESNPSPRNGNAYYYYFAIFGENHLSILYRDRLNTSSQNDLPSVVREEANNYIRDARRDGWRFLSRKELPGGAVEFELEGTITGFPVRSRVRIYVTDRRVYFLRGNIQYLKGANAGILPRFFKSFALLDYQ
jgi:hypothetical protein